MNFESEMSFKMHKNIFFQDFIACPRNLIFSDLVPQTLLSSHLALADDDLC